MAFCYRYCSAFAFLSSYGLSFISRAALRPCHTPDTYETLRQARQVPDPLFELPLRSLAPLAFQRAGSFRLRNTGKSSSCFLPSCTPRSTSEGCFLGHIAV